MPTISLSIVQITFKSVSCNLKVVSLNSFLQNFVFICFCRATRPKISLAPYPTIPERVPLDLARVIKRMCGECPMTSVLLQYY